jgi:translocation and assembly module TamB
MRLDVVVRTSPNVAFETSLAQDIQADVDLRVRGTLASPGVVGRITITHGEMVFFGTKYTVSQGSIAFYDPNRINPILNIDLQTTAKGVNVVLNVSGPMDNMKLTHRSDPPLQFNEIIALLATGRTPTSDPNLVAKEPATPPQSLQQMGQSALLSQAIANPVFVRTKSEGQIDPTFTSGSELPQARLTLQQQISSDITFTYITNLNQTNSQIVRVEWALNPEWLAVATREETGRFGVDFFYRRSFR